MSVVNVVAMPLLPAKELRGSKVRCDLSYAKYSRATWEWWCKRNRAEFVPLERSFGPDPFPNSPPTVTRWAMPELLVKEYGPQSRIALVDADTMIRWDAPNFFDLAGTNFAAVLGANPYWIDRSVRAYQSMFPELLLPWWEYLNSGIVVLGRPQLPTLRLFLDVLTEFSTEFSRISHSGDYGTDQTPLNFVLRKEREPITLLPRPYNFLNCFPVTPELRSIEKAIDPDWTLFSQKAFSPANVFQFISLGYIWHFTSLTAAREVVMRETWNKICQNYPSSTVNL